MTRKVHCLNKGLCVKQKSYIKLSHFTQSRRKLSHTKICKRIIFSAQKKIVQVEGIE